jgi:hypothetical protein
MKSRTNPGFADQRLRKKDAPLDPANRRISLIVQYLETKSVAEQEGEAAAAPEGAAQEGTAPKGSPESKPEGEAKAPVEPAHKE